MKVAPAKPPGVADVGGDAARKSNLAVVAERSAANDELKLRAWRPKQPSVSLGLAVAYLRNKTPFANLQFGNWSQVLVGQVNCGNFFFVVDQYQRIQGFIGWALTNENLAQDWLENGTGLRDEDCRGGECVVITAWAADNNRANRCLLDTARKLFAGKRNVYFARHYPDGRMRRMRLAMPDFAG